MKDSKIDAFFGKFHVYIRTKSKQWVVKRCIKFVFQELILVDEFSILKMQKKKKYDSNSAIEGPK